MNLEIREGEIHSGRVGLSIQGPKIRLLRKGRDMQIRND